jgi:hypothetical protein
MAHSGKQRHRDRDPRRRQLESVEVPSRNRRFAMTDAERLKIAKSLRDIDAARLAIESQHHAENRAIVRALKVSADRIYDVINELEPVEE